MDILDLALMKKIAEEAGSDIPTPTANQMSYILQATNNGIEWSRNELTDYYLTYTSNTGKFNWFRSLDGKAMNPQERVFFFAYNALSLSPVHEYKGVLLSQGSLYYTGYAQDEDAKLYLFKIKKSNPTLSNLTIEEIATKQPLYYHQISFTATGNGKRTRVHIDLYSYSSVFFTFDTLFDKTTQFPAIGYVIDTNVTPQVPVGIIGVVNKSLISVALFDGTEIGMVYSPSSFVDTVIEM